MTWKEVKYLILSDIYRYRGKVTAREFFRHFFTGEGSKYMIWWRLVKYYRSKGLLYKFQYLFAVRVLRHLSIKLGISIPLGCEIGPGFYIGHFGGIFLNPQVVIGKNCNISQDVTIGQNNRSNAGVPVIGDFVYMAPGAKIFGNIKIRDYCAIGANAVVNRSTKVGMIVVPAPSERIQKEVDIENGLYGSAGFVNRTDYDEILEKP